MRSSISDYAQALYQSVVAHPEQTPTIVANWRTMLRLNKQDRFMPQIIERLGQIEADQANELLVRVVTAQALTEAQLADLTDQLGKTMKKTVIITAEVDPSLIGGIKLFIGDTTIENSIAQRINRLATGLQKGQ